MKSKDFVDLLKKTNVNWLLYAEKEQISHHALCRWYNGQSIPSKTRMLLMEEYAKNLER